MLVFVPAFAQVRAAVDLPAPAQWVDTGIDVQKGDSLGVTLNVRRARARSKPQPIPSGVGTPSGEATPIPAAAMPPPTLTGRIGAITFVVGAKCVAPATGRLFLRMNPWGAYSGSESAAAVRVSISHVPGALPTASAVKTILPNVVGMRFAAAARSLKKYSLAARRRNVSSSRPAGEVLEQSPAPGAGTETARVVILTVSDGSLAENNVSPSQPRTTPQTVLAPVPPNRGVLLPPAATLAPPLASVAQSTAAPVRTARPIRTAVPPRPTATAAPAPTATAAPATAQPATAKPPTAQPRKPASPRAAAPPRPAATPLPATSAAAAAMVSVPSVVGLTQQDAAATVARGSLRAVYRGDEPSPLQAGRVTRTDPAAGARLTRGALVGYWLASGESVVSNLGAPGNAWILWLIVAGVAVVGLLGGLALNGRMRLARTTIRSLTIQPSLSLDGPTSFAGGVAMAGPATHLRASLEDGEASFSGGGALVERKERDG